MARQSVSGFPEWLPGERIVEQHVIDTLRRVFELHGFVGIETRAVEPLPALEAKGETSKEVYVLQRLQAARAAAEEAGVADPLSSRTLGLHFDLTVPLARYVPQNANDLVFPLRRYQIQKVWRGERPQEGRFREFTQADIDIVGFQHLGFHHEVEAAQVMLEALDALGIGPVRMEVNNRKLLQALLGNIGGGDESTNFGFNDVLRVLDKYDKVGPEGVADELRRATVPDHQIDLVLKVAAISTTSPDELRDQVTALGIHGDDVDLGLNELCALLEGASAVAPGQVRASLRIARGLDYYTGSVYETLLPGYEGFGSICSGGRYDSLVSEGRRTYPGVGLSIGVTRLVSLILSHHLLQASRPTPTVVLVAVNSEDTRSASNAVAAELRARGISTQVSHSAAKFGKQIREAERRGIPYVWFPNAQLQDEGTADDQVKDIRSGEQHHAEAKTWTPPAQDLHPVVQAPGS